MANSLHEELNNTYYKHFPIVISKRKMSDKPWITARIRSWKRQWGFDIGDQVEFRAVRNLAQREIAKRKTTYYPRKVHILKQTESSQ